MIKQKIFNRRTCVFLIVALLLFEFALSVFPIVANAATGYSSVLEDLERDPAFNAADYPAIEGDTSIQVIHIGEGEDGELFLYTYQPSNATKHYKAKYINMSLQSATELNPSYSLYSLTWLNSDGVFDKYIVNDFTIPAQEYRNYTIVGIYRPYDENVDTSSSSEAIDSKQYRSFPVAQTWCVYYYNDILIYEMETMKYVQYENLASGSVRYTEGFKLYTDKCDSHYVAMKIELIDGEKAYEIEKIYDADITYTISNWATTVYASTGETFVSSREGGGTYEKTLTEFDTGSNEGDGLLGKKYTWNRISTVEEFKTSVQEDANEDFSQEELDALNQADFVFRICETDYEVSNNLGSTVTEWSSVSNIGLLRLHFLSEGKVYNLGCVGDLVGTDSDPELSVSELDNFINTIEEQDWFLKIMMLLCGILIIALLIFLSGPLSLVGRIVWDGLKFIINLVWAIVTLPFRLLWRLIFGR